MKRSHSIGSVAMAVLAGLALFANIACDLFAPVYVVEFRPYTGTGFIPGEVLLTMHSRETMKSSTVRGVVFIGPDGKKMVKWKGNLTGELVLAEKNDPEFPTYVRQMRRDWEKDRYIPLSILDMFSPSEIVELPSDIPVVPDQDRDEQTVIMCVITAVSIGHERREQLNAVIVNLRYPYGKKQVYMPGAATSVAARFIAMGHKVKIFDLNLDYSNDGEVEVFRQAVFDADIVGISLVGAPNIPNAIGLVNEIRKESSIILIGGQPIEALSQDQFRALFPQDNVRQIVSDHDLVDILGRDVSEIVSPFETPFSLAWSCGAISDDRLAEYMRHEMPLVVSQGCKYSCQFCAARKGRRERFRDINAFAFDIGFMAHEAQEKGIPQHNFYATSLDFFQNPETITQYLQEIAEVRRESGINIRVRCLSCVRSFIEASKKIPNFASLLQDAGLYCVAVGVDGTSDEVWKAQRKHHNSMSEVWRFVSLCKELGIKGEALMVMGFPEDTLKTSWTNIISAWKFRRAGVTPRPYCAKTLVPGNDNWHDSRYADTVRQIIENPELFYNLDFAAFGSPLTHPRRLHRWMTNVTYAVVCAIGWSTSPLIPQGEKGVYRRLARWVNQRMPFDR